MFGRTPRVGLVGSNNQKGLGHQNRDLVRHLGIQDWLMVGGDAHELQDAIRLASRVERLGHGPEQVEAIERFLRCIDVLLFVESPLISGLLERARLRGIQIVCVPNWEWIQPGVEWLRLVDLMICPTQFTHHKIGEWRSNFGYSWRVEYSPWPIDASAFRFRVRNQCARFVHINGTDVRHLRDRSGRTSYVRRKGLETLLEVARRLPRIPFLVWSQVNEIPEMPDNVELRKSTICNADLYHEGDICVQLSRWEGLGLPLLECQAAGMPLITTDEAPMNEHNPLAVVPVGGREVLELWPGRWIAAPLLAVDDVVSVCRAWIGQDIADHSRGSRLFVEREHSWVTFRNAVFGWFQELT